MDRLKRQLLDAAAEKDVHLVHQLDGWVLPPGAGDFFMQADDAGDGLTAGESYELRRSPRKLAVRVHVHAGTSPEVAIRVLRKITAWLECQPHLVQEPRIEPPELADAKTVAALAGVAVEPSDCVRLLRVAHAASLLPNGGRATGRSSERPYQNLEAPHGAEDGL